MHSFWSDLHRLKSWNDDDKSDDKGDDKGDDKAYEKDKHENISLETLYTLGENEFDKGAVKTIKNSPCSSPRRGLASNRKLIINEDRSE